jgi:hypothetical protein
MKKFAWMAFLAGTSLLSMPTYADEIRFFAINHFPKPIYFRCVGPFFRNSGTILIPAFSEGSPPPVHFYSAQINAFSPFGLWNCSVGLGPGFPSSFSTGCIEAKSPPYEFYVTARNTPPTPTIVLHVGQNSCSRAATVLAAAYLGNPTTPGQTSQNAFLVSGGAGDTVTVTLDRDGSKGSTGEVAQLRLMTVGGATLAQQQGALPLVLQATLPSSSTVLAEAVAVPDSAAGSDGAFRGYYTLTVTDNSDNEVQLEPLPSTQH